MMDRTKEGKVILTGVGAAWAFLLAAVPEILLAGGGISSLDPWDEYDQGRILLDNLVVTVIPDGTCIIVR